MEEEMHHRIGLATVCLHISAVLYVGVGLLMAAVLYSPPGDKLIRGVAALAVFLLCLALAVGIEFVAAGLRRRRFWAWVAGLCIFAIYLPSLFFPLGALGMWGLLDAGSRVEFGVGTRR
jgi:chromate transport protein ChrA